MQNKINKKRKKKKKKKAVAPLFTRTHALHANAVLEGGMQLAGTVPETQAEPP